jgi:hypothetical protein
MFEINSSLGGNRNIRKGFQSSIRTDEVNCQKSFKDRPDWVTHREIGVAGVDNNYDEILPKDSFLSIEEKRQDNYHAIKVTDKDNRDNLSVTLSRRKIQVENKGEKASSFLEIGRITNLKAFAILQEKLKPLNGQEIDEVSLTKSFDKITGQWDRETLSISVANKENPKIYNASVDKNDPGFLTWGIIGEDKSGDPSYNFEKFKI